MRYTNMKILNLNRIKGFASLLALCIFPTTGFAATTLSCGKDVGPLARIEIDFERNTVNLLARSGEKDNVRDLRIDSTNPANLFSDIEKDPDLTSGALLRIDFRSPKGDQTGNVYLRLRREYIGYNKIDGEASVNLDLTFENRFPNRIDDLHCNFEKTDFR